MDEMNEEEIQFFRSLGMDVPRYSGWRAYCTARRWLRNVECLVGEVVEVNLYLLNRDVLYAYSAGNHVVYFVPRARIEPVVSVDDFRSLGILMHRLKCGEKISELVMN